MSKQTINNGDSGLTARNSINNNFTELYNSIYIPIKLEGVTGNTSQAIAENTFIQQISLITVTGNPTIRIGTTPNGTDILPDTTSASISLTTLQQYFANATTFYITVSAGSGEVNIRFDVMTNFF